MNSKNKGFTLIELLAVILILGIIALIAIPTVSNIIKDSKNNANLRSIDGYIKAVENASMKSILNSNSEVQESGVYTVEELNGKVDYKGKGPTEGWVQIVSNDVIDYSLKIDNSIINYNDTTNRPVLSDSDTLLDKPSGSVITKLPKNLQMGNEVYINPQTGYVCTIEEYNSNTDASKTGHNTGCMKWNVYKSEDTSYQLILDHNTTGSTAWNSNGNKAPQSKEVEEELNLKTKNWKSSLSIRVIKAEEIAQIVGADKDTTIKWNTTKPFQLSNANPSIQSSWFYLDGERSGNNKVYPDASNGWQTQIAKSEGASNYAWLYDNTYGCKTAGCNYEDSDSRGYWTSTKTNDSALDAAWFVNINGSLSRGEITTSNWAGVRPVITYSKEA